MLCQGHLEEEDVTSQCPVYLCSYHTVSQGPVNSSTPGLVQEVGKTHKTSRRPASNRELTALSQAATSICHSA